MQKKNLILVTLGHLSCDVNGGALPAALPFIRSACHLDYQATGGLMLAYSCLSSILQPFLGWLADRHTKPWFIPLGVAMAGLGLALTGFLTHYWAIFIAIIFSGAGSAFFHPEGARYANKISGKRKGAAMSVFSIGGNIGFILGPLLVTVFAGSFGLRGMAVFGVLSLCAASALWLQISRLPGSAAGRDAPDKGDKSPGRSGAGQKAGEKPVQEGRNNWREFTKLIFVVVSRSLAFTGCNTFIPLYMVNALGQSPSMGGAALVVFGASGVAFNILGGFLGDRLGYIAVIRIAFSILPLSLVCFSLADSAALGYLLLPILALPLYLPFSAQVVLGQKLLAKNIGFASGVTLGLATTLGGIAQPVLGWLADNWGLRSIFYALACVGLAGAAMSWLLNRSPR